MNNSQGHIHNFHRLCKTCHFISKSITHWFVPIYISLIVARLENVAFEWSFWTSKMVYDVSFSSCADVNYGWFITVSPIKERILKSLEDIVATLRVQKTFGNIKADSIAYFKGLQMSEDNLFPRV